MRHLLWLTASAVVLGGIGYAAPAGVAPKARYQMDVATTSGFMASGANPMRAMFGGRGGGSVAHTLTLRLGSTLAATGAPAADHFMPAGMNLGPSVPLVTPTPTAATGPAENGPPGEMRRPKGRLLLFWGCGAHAGPGQPVIVDFSKLGQNQFPPGLFSASVPGDVGPTAANSRTYGDWPNARSSKQPGSDSSLIGEHRVAGNYSPEIRFSLDQDFMPALQARGTAQPDGSQMLSWNGIPVATGYYAWTIGAKSMGEDNADMVWWTSASAKEFGGGLTDWLSPATVASLIARRVVMPPTQTSCQIPAEVKAAAGEFMMTQLYAYGPERDFAYPERPANPKVAWRPDWTARVRYRANTSLMLGMPGMGDTGDDDGGRNNANGGNNGQNGDGGKKKCKPKIGLGGIKLC